MDLEDKINIVKGILKDKKVAIGFSGGADSTLMAHLSSEVAGETLAITINNHIFPTDFIQNTRDATELLGIKHKIVDINFYEDEYFISNDSARCHTCRKLMYDYIQKIAIENGFNFICDGNNISDLVIDRPGILVTYEKGFETPFIEARLTSKEIHEYLNTHGITYSRSTTCLATRIPANTPISKEKIRRISYCEDYILNSSDCEIVKVRDFGKTCICEVDNIENILKDCRFKYINRELLKQGYEKVALNLTPIDDDEYIKLDYKNESFSYKLPYTLNMENTIKQLKNEIIYESENKIELENITIYENGLIEGHGLKSYENALDTFMEVLSKIRRNIQVKKCQQDI